MLGVEVSAADSYLCRTPKYINIYRLGSGLIGNIDIWQGLEGHPAGLSKGLKDNSEQSYSMGFPLISAMMALSPPKYS